MCRPRGDCGVGYALSIRVYPKEIDFLGRFVDDRNLGIRTGSAGWTNGRERLEAGCLRVRRLRSFDLVCFEVGTP